MRREDQELLKKREREGRIASYLNSLEWSQGKSGSLVTKVTKNFEGLVQGETLVLGKDVGRGLIFAQSLRNRRNYFLRYI